MDRCCRQPCAAGRVFRLGRRRNRLGRRRDRVGLRSDMPSNIDATKPVTGNPTTQSMRDNFAAAKTEIEALQTSVTAVQSTMNLTSGSSSLVRMSGDLAGMAANPIVSRLYGRNISAAAPTAGQPLIWDGTAWAPGSAGAVGNYIPLTGANNVGPIGMNSVRGAYPIFPSSGTNPPALTVTFDPNSSGGLWVDQRVEWGHIEDGIGLSCRIPAGHWMITSGLATEGMYGYYTTIHEGWLTWWAYMTNNSTGTWPADFGMRLKFADSSIGEPWGVNRLELRGRAFKDGGGAWETLSDARLKTNVEAYPAGLEEIAQLNPVTFRYNGRGETRETGRVYIGLTADDVKPVMPEMVRSVRGKIDYDDSEDTDILTLDASPLIFAIVNALKEINHRLKALEGNKRSK